MICKIKSIKKVEKFKTTYDIETENHNFVANQIVVHNSQGVSDHVMTNRILPMMGSYERSKIIKIGVPKYRNHFYKSFISPMYKKLVFDWTQSPILLQSGSIKVKDDKGVEKEVSRYCLDRMPLSLKKKYFPNNPELHYDGDMTELDFKTQYMAEWVDSISLLLSEEDQIKLASGKHRLLKQGLVGEEYYFGLDFASGTILPNRTNLDSTVLVVGRKTNENIKEIVWVGEWQGNPLDVMKEIMEVINPINGLFKCKFGLIDYSVVGVTATEYYKREHIACDGIIFGSTEKNSRKNYKNAMYDQFMFELKSDRIFYPGEDIDTNVILKKSYNEFCSIERIEGLGINAKIEAVSGNHDDHPTAIVLFCYAADKNSNFKTSSLSGYKIPQIITGGTTVSSFASGGRSSNSSFGEMLKRGR